MATYTKPTKLPRWADTSLNIVEPAEAKKDAGWLFEEIPPSGWENWRTNLIGDWFRWIDERWVDSPSGDIKAALPLYVVSNNFVLWDNAGDARISFQGTGGGSFIMHDVSVNSIEFWITGSEQLNIGNGAVAVPNQLQIGGGGTFNLTYSGSDQRINFKGVVGNTYVQHDVTNDDIELWAGGVENLRATPTGLELLGTVNGVDMNLTNGLCVGFAGTPAADTIQIGASHFKLWYSAGDGVLEFDANDMLWYDQSVNIAYIRINSSDEFSVGSAGATVNKGLNVGFVGSAIDNAIQIGASTFSIRYIAGDVAFVLDGTNDQLWYDASLNKLSLRIGGVDEWKWTATALDCNANSITNVIDYQFTNSGTKLTDNSTGAEIAGNITGSACFKAQKRSSVSDFATFKMRATSTNAVPVDGTDAYSITTWNSIVYTGRLVTNASGAIVSATGWNHLTSSNPSTGVYNITVDYALNADVELLVTLQGSMTGLVGRPIGDAVISSGNIVVNCYDSANGTLKNLNSGNINVIAVGRTTVTAPSI